MLAIHTHTHKKIASNNLIGLFNLERENPFTKIKKKKILRNKLNRPQPEEIIISPNKKSLAPYLNIAIFNQKSKITTIHPSQSLYPYYPF